LAGAIGPNEVDVIFLEDFLCARQSPIDRLEEFPFKHVELRHSYAAHFGVEIVGAKNIAETFACDCYGGDDEPMTG